jgi:cytochrome c oxidase assembly protein subunit 15
LAKLSSKITAGLFVAGVIQAIIGVAQARLGVPPFLVAAHMLGASVIIALLTFNLVANKSSK